MLADTLQRTLQAGQDLDEHHVDLLLGLDDLAQTFGKLLRFTSAMADDLGRLVNLVAPEHATEAQMIFRHHGEISEALSVEIADTLGGRIPTVAELLAELPDRKAAESG